MVTRRIVIQGGFATATVLLHGCGSGGSNNKGPGGSNNPVPAISALQPSSAAAGASSVSMTVSGSNFISGSVVEWNGTALSTTYTGATSLSAVIPTVNLGTAGTASVTVFNPSPGGGTSNTSTFTINATTNPMPTLALLQPASAVAGAPSFSMTVTGSNFINGSTVEWNGTALTTTFVSASSLTAVVPASDVSAAGSANVTVVNPAPGGGTSNSSAFTISASTGSGIGSFQLTAASAQSAAPFTLGQPCRQGDVPSGQYLGSSLPNFQATVMNRWPDGSVKFAVLSGVAALSANSPLSVSLTSSSTAPSSATLQESDLIALAPNVSMACGSVGTVTLASLLGKAASGGDGVGLVRSFLGPVMSEFHYRGAVGSNAHLRVYFVCRLYTGNQLEVETIVENGFCNVASPTAWSYVPSLTVNGRNIWNNGGASFTHYHHTRVQFFAWYGTDPQVQIAHDTAYCRKTRLVPNYGSTSISSGFLNGLASSYTPYMQGNYTSDWGSTGAQNQIGLLPNWDAAYWVTGNAQAWQAVIVNTQIAGGFQHHYRDETTGRPVLPRSYPTSSLGNGSNVVNSSAIPNQQFPDNSGGSPPYPTTGWNIQHHPDMGYSAYLMTGRWSFLEEAQFQIGMIGVMQYGLSNNGTHFNGSPIFDTRTGNSTRGNAWSFRDLAFTAAITPDNDSAQRTEWLQIAADNIQWYVTQYVGTANAIGMAESYDNTAYGNESGFTNITAMGMFQEDFMTQSLGILWDLQLPLSSTAASNLNTLLSWKFVSVVGRFGLGVGSSEYCFEDACAFYSVALADSVVNGTAAFNAAVYPNWGTIYTKTLGYKGQTAGSCGNGGALRGTSGSDPSAVQSYWDNMLPALSIATDFGATGASAGYAFLTGASNWSSVQSAFADNPVWYVLPRSV